MLGEDVLYLSVRELGERIRKRSLSPVELTQSYLERSRKIGARLNAYVTLTPDLALEQARAAERELAAGKYRGPLHGIPYAAKDLLAVPGYPTTWGARPYANQKFDTTATVIRKLQDAGAVLLGKAAMIELAGGLGYRYASASLTGPSKNPWNEGCWTCGSSSGSGAIVAAGLAGFAIGTETWGSIICPSAFCGVSGLRPTFGRVSRSGAMALAYSMDKIGPMARTADDCAIVLSAIAGHDPQDAATLPDADGRFEYHNSVAPRKPLRIGWLTEQWGKKAPADVTAIARQAVNVLTSQGATVSDAKLPEGPFEAVGGMIIGAEAASAFEKLIESGGVAQLNDRMGQVGGYVGQQIASSDFLHGMRLRSILQERMNELFQQFDLLAASSQATPATPIEMKLDDESLDFADPLGGIGNLCGLPAVSVPCGFKNNLPIGIQFVGRVLEDATVVAAAHAYQQQTEWHKKRPPVS